MRPPVRRSGLASIAVLTLSAGLAACGGGGGTSALSPAGAGAGTLSPSAASGVSTLGSAAFSAQSAPGRYALGFIGADPRTIARLAHIRHAQGTVVLPLAVDLSATMPAVGNQGQEGSCVAWASAYAMRGYEARQDVWSSIAPKSTDPTLNFSPAFVYNQVNGGHDSGTSIPAALGLLQQKGAATLADMPYLAGQYTTQPSAAALADAVHYKLSSYGYIAATDLNSMKVQLAAGIPVVLAIKVYYNFFGLGQNQVYTAIGGAYQGGHAVTIVGYDDAKQAVEIINSWGPYWSTAGYGWISYTALNQIALEAYSAIDDHGVPVKPTPTATPVPKPTSSATPAPKPTPTATPAPRPTPTATPAPKPTSSATPAPKPTSSATPAPKPTPTATPAPKPTSSATPAPKPSSNVTPTPAPSASAKPTATPTPKSSPTAASGR